jgi:hypothetical protein
MDTKQYIIMIFITYPLAAKGCEEQLGHNMLPCGPEYYGLFFRLIYSIDL